MKEEFKSDGLPETEGNAFIEAGKTRVTMKDSEVCAYQVLDLAGDSEFPVGSGDPKGTR